MQRSGYTRNGVEQRRDQYVGLSSYRGHYETMHYRTWYNLKCSRRCLARFLVTPPLQPRADTLPIVIVTHQLLLGLGKTDCIVLEVVDRVPLAQESVSENCERTGRLWDVEAHEGGDTAALDLKNVVV